MDGETVKMDATQTTRINLTLPNNFMEKLQYLKEIYGLKSEQEVIRIILSEDLPSRRMLSLVPKIPKMREANRT